MKNNNKYAPIGVMDSGVGGLTVLKHLQELCPNEKYIYTGDTKNLPYGEKTKDELIKIAKKVFDFYANLNTKAVVMACNTTSATVYDELKNDYDFEIYPIIQIISQCITQNKNINKIAIMATNATVNSGKYTEELKKNNPKIKTFEQACPLWVPVVEKKLKEYNKEKIITEYLDKVLAFQPEKIILGCTHYPYLLNELEKYAPRDIFVNPAMTFAKFIKEDLTKNELLSPNKNGKTVYYASANPKEFKENAKLFMDLQDEPQIIDL